MQAGLLRFLDSLRNSLGKGCWMGKASIYHNEEGKKQIALDYEEYLNSLNAEFERVYVPTRFGKTHMLVTGPSEGKPIFILQGGNCINPMTLSWFLPLQEEYRIYAPDTLGHPGFSEENRMSASDDSFAQWITDLLNYFDIEKSAFIGPSYGAGIILRLAAFCPEKISCAVLVSPAGIKIGSKLRMIKDILIPLILFKRTSSRAQLKRITGVMSDNSMKETDEQIIGDVFKYLKLEQEMPKLTEKSELRNYHSPTLVIAGKKDVFFPERKLNRTAKEIIPNLIQFQALDMGHFPSQEHLKEINSDIKKILRKYYD